MSWSSGSDLQHWPTNHELTLKYILLKSESAVSPRKKGKSYTVPLQAPQHPRKKRGKMLPPLSTPSPTSTFRPLPITSNLARRYTGRDSFGRHVQIQQLLEPSPTLHGSNPLRLRLKRPRAVRLSRRISHLPAVGSNRGKWVMG